MSSTAAHLATLATLAAAVGCHSVGEPGDIAPESLLKAAVASPESVALDVYWCRTKLNDEAVGERLWASVQEDRIPVEVRRRLAENGLRAGVVGGNPSAEIVRLLNPTGADLQAEDQEVDAESITGPAKVTRTLFQMRPGRRVELQVSDTPRPLSLLRRDKGVLTGRSYQDANGLYGMEVQRVADAGVEVVLTPELHHGQPRMQYTPTGPGMVVQRLARETEVFAELKTSVALTPGEMLLVAGLPEAGHRLGGLLHHIDGPEGPQQKLLLVRLGQVPSGESLAARNSAWPW